MIVLLTLPLVILLFSLQHYSMTSLLGLLPNKLEAEVTVTVHRVVRCTNFVADSDRHLDRSRNNSTEDWPQTISQ